MRTAFLLSPEKTFGSKIITNKDLSILVLNTLASCFNAVLQKGEMKNKEENLSQQLKYFFFFF